MFMILRCNWLTISPTRKEWPVIVIGLLIDPWNVHSQMRKLMSCRYFIWQDFADISFSRVCIWWRWLITPKNLFFFFFNCGVQWNVREQVQSKLNVVLRWGFLVRCATHKFLQSILLIYSFYLLQYRFKLFLQYSFKPVMTSKASPKIEGDTKFLNNKVIQRFCFSIFNLLWR